MTPEQKQTAEFIVFIALAIGAAVWKAAKIDKRLDDLEAALVKRIEGNAVADEPAEPGQSDGH